MSDTPEEIVLTLNMHHDKVTPKKIRFTGATKDGSISASVYIVKSMSIHEVPDKIILDLDLASLSG